VKLLPGLTVGQRGNERVHTGDRFVGKLHLDRGLDLFMKKDASFFRGICRPDCRLTCISYSSATFTFVKLRLGVLAFGEDGGREPGELAFGVAAVLQCSSSLHLFIYNYNNLISEFAD